MSTLTSIELVLIQKLVKARPILDVINTSIENIVNSYNGNTNVRLSEKYLFLNVVVIDNDKNNMAIANNRVFIENLKTLIPECIKDLDDDIISDGCERLIYEIELFDNNITDITFKTLDGNNVTNDIIFNLLRYRQISLLVTFEPFIEKLRVLDTTLSLNNKKQILHYCYSILLIYYISLQYTQTYIEYLNKYLWDCIQEKKIGFLRISLGNVYPPNTIPNYNRDASGHATMMIFNGVNRTLEYFDPNGETPSAGYYNDSIASLFSRILYLVTPEIVNFQPIIKGDVVNIQGNINFNLINSTKQSYDFGICGLYSAWFLHQRLMYIASNDYYNKLVNNQIDDIRYITDSKSQYLRAALFYESRPRPNVKKNDNNIIESNIITPILNYSNLNKSLILKEYHRQIALTNHESILKYGIKCLSNIKINNKVYGIDLIVSLKNIKIL